MATAKFLRKFFQIRNTVTYSSGIHLGQMRMFYFSLTTMSLIAGNKVFERRPNLSRDKLTQIRMPRDVLLFSFLWSYRNYRRLIYSQFNYRRRDIQDGIVSKLYLLLTARGRYERRSINPSVEPNKRRSSNSISACSKNEISIFNCERFGGGERGSWISKYSMVEKTGLV